MKVACAGGCLCTYVRYRYEGVFGPAAYCHCEDCRRVTGSAFNVGVRIEVSGLVLVGGAVKTHTKFADSGHPISRSFCPDCGSPLYTASRRHPEWYYLKAGSLDDPTLVMPRYQSWSDSAVSWRIIDPELPSHPRTRPPGAL
jgi:hypothetical protein